MKTRSSKKNAGAQKSSTSGKRNAGAEKSSTAGKGKAVSEKVVYRLLEGASANVELEVSSLDEFLSMAFANEWIILLNVQKLPPGPIEWCPFLQPRLLQEGEIAKQIRNTKCLNKLIVIRKSDPAAKELIPKFVDAETAFVRMLQLFEEEVVSTAKAEAEKQKIRNEMSASTVKMEAAKQKIKNKASVTEGSDRDTFEDAQRIHQESGQNSGDIVEDVQMGEQGINEDTRASIRDDMSWFDHVGNGYCIPSWRKM